MNDTQELTLAHPLVQEAKKRWKRSRRKSSLSFEEYFEWFKGNDKTFTEIAARIGVTRQCVQQIYSRHFKSLFENASGRKRRSDRIRRTKMRTAERSLMDFIVLDPVVKEIAKQTLAAECTIRAVPRMKDDLPTGQLNTYLLVVNGHTCLVRSSSRGWKPPAHRRTYMRVTLTLHSLSKSDAVIFLVSVPGFPRHLFVVPSDTLKRTFSRKELVAGRKVVCVPTQKLPVYRNAHASLDWWSYENAWHLLEKESPGS